MLDLKFIKDNPSLVKENLINRNLDPKILDEILRLDLLRVSLIQKVDQARSVLKQNSGNKKPDQATILDLRKKSQEEKKMASELKNVETDLFKQLAKIPNISSKDTPVGKDETENKLLTEFGQIKLSSGIHHDEIMEKFNLVDIKRASKISGSRFYFLKNEAVEIEIAIIKYVIEEAKKNHYEIIIPPVLIHQELGKLAGHPEVETEEAYHTKEDDLYLIGSSEHSIMAMHSDEVIPKNKLPLRYLGFSTCFRREAGSYGKDVKGILRTHQFDKLELVSIVSPDKSEEEFESLLNFEINLIKKLNLPFRTIELCTGDISHAASRQVDIETWIPSQKKYRETHSCSNCTDYQTRGLKIFTQDKDNKRILTHGLNATAFAIGRILIAIIENNYDQRNDTINIPGVLHQYLSFSQIKKS